MAVRYLVNMVTVIKSCKPSFNNIHIVTLEWMNHYIYDIKCRILQSKLPPEYMKIVENFESFKQDKSSSKRVNFKKLMKQLLK